MTLNLINTGAAPNDGTGDPLRDAFQKTNSAIAEVNDILVSQTNVVIVTPAVPPSTVPEGLPAPVGGVITLADNTTYQPRGSVTVSDRIVFGVNSAIVGIINTQSQLVYLGADTFISADNNRLYIKDCGIITTNLNSTMFSKTGNEFFTMRGFFFDCVGDFGTIEAVGNDAIFNQGFGIFDGSGFKIGSAGAATSYFNIANTRIIQKTASPVVDIVGASLDELVISENQFIPLGNGSCIAADAGNVNINKSAGIRNNDFQMSNGQAFLSGGVTVKDINWFFSSDNKGIEFEPSIILGSALLSGNASITSLTAGVPNSIAGTFIVGSEDQRMNSSSGVVTNTSGSILQAVLLAQGTVNNQGGGTEGFTFEFYINGVVVPNVTATVNVDGNDQNTWVMTANAKIPLSAQVNVRVTNASGTDCIIPDMQFSVQGIR